MLGVDFDLVVGFMRVAERVTNFQTGVEKKEFVLRQIRQTMGTEIDPRILPFVESLIDNLVSLDRGDLELGLKKTRGCLTRMCCPKKKNQSYRPL